MSQSAVVHLQHVHLEVTTMLAVILHVGDLGVPLSATKSARKYCNESNVMNNGCLRASEYHHQAVQLTSLCKYGVNRSSIELRVLQTIQISREIRS